MLHRNFKHCIWKLLLFLIVAIVSFTFYKGYVVLFASVNRTAKSNKILASDSFRNQNKRHYSVQLENLANHSEIPRIFLSASKYKPPFCDSLFHADPTSIRKATMHMKRIKRLKITDTDYIGMIENHGCNMFRKIRGYRTMQTSSEEKKFPLAFGILVYKDIDQVERLLRALYMPQNYYCLHVDKKAPEIFKKAIGKIVSCFHNVFVASKLYDVRWGRYSVLQADLACPRELIKYKDWKYFFNLAGQEFPLMSNRQLVRMAMMYDGASDNIVVRNSEMLSHWKERVKFVFKWNGNDMWPRRTSIRKNKAPHNLEFRRGELHLVASRKFIEFVLTNRVAVDFQKWLNGTNIPDESFYSTLISFQKNNCIPGAFNTNDEVHTRNSHTRWKHWADHEGHKCHGKVVRLICIPGLGDLSRIVANITKPIINKIHVDYEYLVFDCMEEYIASLQEEAKRDDFYFNEAYYKNLNFVRYRKKC